MIASPQQYIELFHLLFLRALIARGEDKTLCILKGGCNLRFFFGSVRYSEDIDIDVTVTAKETLKKKVDRILSAPNLVAPLKAHGITISEASAPKQTDTTQRWKVALAVDRFDVALRTKIEFSRRPMAEQAAFEPIDRNLARSYGLPPFLASHYALNAAICQKIRALKGRAEAQARDIFDLNLLLARPEAANILLSNENKKDVPKAIERATDISFDEYAATVIAFLDPHNASVYNTRDAWHLMQDTVIVRLNELL